MDCGSDGEHGRQPVWPNDTTTSAATEVGMGNIGGMRPCSCTVQKGQFTRMDINDAGFPIVWGHTFLEPDRGHVRESETHVVDGAVVGFAICGAWLIDDLPVQEGDFPRCSYCLGLLDEHPPSSPSGGE